MLARIFSLPCLPATPHSKNVFGQLVANAMIPNITCSASDTLIESDCPHPSFLAVLPGLYEIRASQGGGISPTFRTAAGFFPHLYTVLAQGLPLPHHEHHGLSESIYIVFGTDELNSPNCLCC